MVLIFQGTIFVFPLRFRKRVGITASWTTFSAPSHIPLAQEPSSPTIGLLALCQLLLPRREAILFIRPLPVDMEPPPRSLSSTWPSSPGHRAPHASHLEVGYMGELTCLTNDIFKAVLSSLSKLFFTFIYVRYLWLIGLSFQSHQDK